MLDILLELLDILFGLLTGLLVYAIARKYGIGAGLIVWCICIVIGKNKRINKCGFNGYNVKPEPHL